VDHTLSRFKGAGEREFELAVAQARSTGLMNCNSFLDFGIGVNEMTGSDVFKLLAQDGGGYTHYIAAMSPSVSPRVFPKKIWSTVYQALMHAQSTGVDGMWINLSDNVADSLDLRAENDGVALFDGVVEGVKNYWEDVCGTKPEAHVGSVVVGAGVNIYDELGGTSRVTAIVPRFMTFTGVLKLK